MFADAFVNWGPGPQQRANQYHKVTARHMDLFTARALLLTTKNAPPTLDRVVRVLLQTFLTETWQWAVLCRYCSRLLKAPIYPARRCRMKRGRGRCRNIVSDIAIVQFCSYHQQHCIADKDIAFARYISHAAAPYYRPTPPSTSDSQTLDTGLS